MKYYPNNALEVIVLRIFKEDFCLQMLKSGGLGVGKSCILDANWSMNSNNYVDFYKLRDIIRAERTTGFYE